MSKWIIQIIAIVAAIAVLVVIAVPGVMPAIRDAFTSNGDAPTETGARPTSNSSNSASAASRVKASTKPVRPRVGYRAPDFALRDPQGNLHKLSDYLGEVVVLDFWGTWCGPCKKIMPTLQQFHEQYKDRGVNVIGVNYEQNPNADPAAYMRDKGFTYGLLLNGRDVIAKDFKQSSYPTLWVIGVDGEILHYHKGALGDIYGELVETIDPYLEAHGL